MENFRSCKYTDYCRVCGRELNGRGTKRLVEDPDSPTEYAYECYGRHLKKKVKVKKTV